MTERTYSKPPLKKTRLAIALATASTIFPSTLPAGTNTTLTDALFPSVEIRQADAQSPLLVATNHYTEDDAVNKFFDVGYTYCDARVLSDFWDWGEPYDAKVTLGEKMLYGGPDEALHYVPDARVHFLQQADDALPCDYTDGGFAYEDAEKLAKYWGSTVADSKIKMSRYLIAGYRDSLEHALTSMSN